MNHTLDHWILPSPTTSSSISYLLAAQRLRSSQQPALIFSASDHACPCSFLFALFTALFFSLSLSLLKTFWQPIPFSSSCRDVMFRSTVQRICFPPVSIWSPTLSPSIEGSLFNTLSNFFLMTLWGSASYDNRKSQWKLISWAVWLYHLRHPSACYGTAQANQSAVVHVAETCSL